MSRSSTSSPAAKAAAKAAAEAAAQAELDAAAEAAAQAAAQAAADAEAAAAAAAGPDPLCQHGIPSADDCVGCAEDEAARAAAPALDPIAAALAAQVDALNVTFEASGSKTSEDPAPDPEPAADPRELAEGEEVIGRREEADGSGAFVTSFGRRVAWDADGENARQTNGVGTIPDHDQPAPQPGTPEHARHYGDS